MESLSIFFDIFYSSPIIFFSLPFSFLFVLVFISVVGLHIDFNLDIEAAEMSEGLKVFLSHFNLSKVPFFLYLFTYSLLGSLTLVLVHDIFGKGLILNIVAFANIYICAKLAGIVLLPLAPLFNANKEQKTNYVGSEATVTSVRLDRNGGSIICEIDDSEHMLNAFIEGDTVLDKGDKVLILNKESDKYLVEKLKELN